jgi:hypothetical protein
MPRGKGKCRHIGWNAEGEVLKALAFLCMKIPTRRNHLQWTTLCSSRNRAGATPTKRKKVGNLFFSVRTSFAGFGKKNVFQYAKTTLVDINVMIQQASDASHTMQHWATYPLNHLNQHHLHLRHMSHGYLGSKCWYCLRLYIFRTQSVS